MTASRGSFNDKEVFSRSVVSYFFRNANLTSERVGLAKNIINELKNAKFPNDMDKIIDFLQSSRVGLSQAKRNSHLELAIDTCQYLLHFTEKSLLQKGERNLLGCSD